MDRLIWESGYGWSVADADLISGLSADYSWGLWLPCPAWVCAMVHLYVFYLVTFCARQISHGINKLSSPKGWSCCWGQWSPVSFNFSLVQAQKINKWILPNNGIYWQRKKLEHLNKFKLWTRTLPLFPSFSHTKEHIPPIVRINCYKIVMGWSTQ